MSANGPSLLSSCRSKRRYRTYEFAEKVRAKCEADRGAKLRTYWCAYCNGWHITRREIERPA